MQHISVLTDTGNGSQSNRKPDKPSDRLPGYDEVTSINFRVAVSTEFVRERSQFPLQTLTVTETHDSCW